MPRTCRPKHLQLTDAEKEKYLEGLRQGLTSSAAALAVGRNTPRCFEVRRDESSVMYDPVFAEAFIEAWEVGKDALVEVARVRAVEGAPVTTVDRSGNEHVTRTPSDRLLEFLIRQRDPSFRDSQPAVTLNTGAVFVLESAFDRPAIEGEVVEGHAVELPERQALSERNG